MGVHPQIIVGFSMTNRYWGAIYPPWLYHEVYKAPHNSREPPPWVCVCQRLWVFSNMDSVVKIPVPVLENPYVGWFYHTRR